MKIARFEFGGKVFHGAVFGDSVRIITGNIFDSYSLTDDVVPLSSVRLLAPCEPGKAVCVGLNYLDHAREMNLELPKQPLIFIKPSSTLNHPGGPVIYHSITNNLHFEAEMAVVIGRTARGLTPENAASHILGYTCANDVTARDIQQGDGQWTRGKSLDSFMPLGPWIETDIDPHAVSVKLLLNGEVRQSSNTANLIFRVPELLSFITQAITLCPGDVVLTGTPAGVGPMRVGDVVTVELGGIGSLTNPVAG